jgi:hypothetical protein
MKYTYDLNTNGCLILTADSIERDEIRALIRRCGTSERAEVEALETLLTNSDLDWIQAEEIGALTSAPILGLRREDGDVTAAWAFMDYQVRSFLEDLVRVGRAVFVS